MKMSQGRERTLRDSIVAMDERVNPTSVGRAQ